MKKIVCSISALACLMLTSCEDSSRRINVNISNFTAEDFQTLSKLETTGGSEGCALKTDAMIGAVRTDLICRKDFKLTEKGIIQVESTMLKYGITKEQIQSLR